MIYVSISPFELRCQLRVSEKRYWRRRRVGGRFNKALHSPQQPNSLILSSRSRYDKSLLELLVLFTLKSGSELHMRVFRQGLHSFSSALGIGVLACLLMV